ncbi:MAG: NTP transferase domain-containing protein [Elusimicrobia bacterium]|nr:NTP transferase domain-containing protein [Elusimicrobiota bacterium]
MILAAGVGSRLKPLTDARPKALIEINGRPMLEIIARRLMAAGVTEIIVNVHHFPGLIADYLAKNKNFGLRVEISREETLLDTGGGLKKAAWFFDDGQPFFLHNVDIINNIDLTRMYGEHRQTGAWATLAAEKRISGRYLLFNQTGNLCGHEKNDGRGEVAALRTKEGERLAFNGVHVISPALLNGLAESGAFSIIDAYLRLAAQGTKILAFRTDGCWSQDIGTLEKLDAAERYIGKKGFPG